MDALEKQNNGHSWRDCVTAGMHHRLRPPVPVVSLYGSTVPDNPSTVRHCRRCPVGILTVRRKEVKDPCQSTK